MALLPFRGKFHYKGMAAKGSEAFVRGAIVTVDATLGYLKVGTAAAVTQLGVAMETTTASATNGATEIIYVPFEDGQEWVADCDSTPTQTEVGTIVGLENTYTVDEDDTSNTPFFEIRGIKDATTKQIYVSPVRRLITAIETS